jgi:hypothetical protein
MLVILLFAASLVQTSYAASVSAKGSSSQPPPIEQPLVREGDFAVELANALNLTSSRDEAAAESSLVSINVTPRNGWISDYPMTPDIIAEVLESTASSASAGSLKISEANAARTVESVCATLNLPIEVAEEKYSYESTAGSSVSSSADSIDSSSAESPSSSAPAPPDVYEYEGPSVVDVPEEEYYVDYGPPIVTYYPPPWTYAYLYDWVPWPFWWGRFGFGGFFILRDFDRRDHHHRFTNHVANANGTMSRVNAVTRSAGMGTPSPSTLAVASRSEQRSRPGSANAKAGMIVIMNRQTGSSVEKATKALTKPRNLASSGPSRDVGNAAGIVRNPPPATRNMDNFTSGSRARTMSRGTVARPPSFSGGAFNGAGSVRFSPGAGYRGGSGSGFSGGSGARGFSAGGHGGGHGGGRHG